MTKFPISLGVPSQEMLKETRGKAFCVYSVHNPPSDKVEDVIVLEILQWQVRKLSSKDLNGGKISPRYRWSWCRFTLTPLCIVSMLFNQFPIVFLNYRKKIRWSKGLGYVYIVAHLISKTIKISDKFLAISFCWPLYLQYFQKI